MPLSQANASTVSQIYVSDKLHNLSANQTRPIVAYRREHSEMAGVCSKEFAVQCVWLFQLSGLEQAEIDGQIGISATLPPCA